MIVLRDKEFAKKDYAGLNWLERRILKKKRSDYAKVMLENYRDVRKGLDSLYPGDTPNPDSGGLRTRYNYAGGGVRSRATVVTPVTNSSVGLTKKDFKNHIGNLIDNYKKNSNDSKALMEEGAIEEAEDLIRKGKRIAPLVGLGAIGLGTAGYYGYKKYKQNKDKKSNKSKNHDSKD